MRLKMKHFLKPQYLSLTIFLLVVFSFQNCAEPLQIEEEDFASKADTYPFAYETKIDTFSYMSCSGFENSVFNNRAVYSFKVLANRPGAGVGLNKEFVDAVGGMRLSKVEEILSEGANNRGAQLQSAFRRRVNLLQYYVDLNSDNGVEGIDYDNILWPLDTDLISHPLITNKGAKLGYFSNLEGLENRRLESYLYFNGSEGLASNLRSSLHTGDLIYTLNYVDSKGDQPTIPMSPEDPKDSAYGLGLRMTFAKGHGLDGIGTIVTFSSKAEARVLQTVNEVDLRKPQVDRPQVDADWVCPSHLSFMIVRPEDNITVMCGVTAATQLSNGFSEDPANLTALNISQEDYNAVRAMLPIEYWHVDFKKRCIVSKESEDKCYDISMSEKPINYHAGRLNFPSTCGAAETESHQCPHYVSICYRRN